MKLPSKFVALVYCIVLAALAGAGIVGEVPGTRCASDIAFRPDGAAAYITYYS